MLVGMIDKHFGTKFLEDDPDADIMDVLRYKVQGVKDKYNRFRSDLRGDWKETKKSIGWEEFKSKIDPDGEYFVKQTRPYDNYGGRNVFDLTTCGKNVIFCTERLKSVKKKKITEIPGGFRIKEVELEETIYHESWIRWMFAMNEGPVTYVTEIKKLPKNSNKGTLVD